jgi:hypothetical protein
MTKVLVAPNGRRIIGTADALEATAYIGDVTQKDDGTFDFDYVGESKVHWDAQDTKVNESGQRLFVDQDYEEWPEDQLKVIEGGEDEDA